MKKLAFMMGAALLLEGCTHAISRDLLNQSRNIPFDQLQADPDLHKGVLVILGGTITTTTIEQRATLIEVMQKSLDKWGRPLRTARSGGTFFVRYPGILDTMVYGPDREITVAGLVEGSLRPGRDGPGVAYPVVLSKELKLWPREPASWSRQQYLDPLYERNGSPLQY